MAAKSAKQVGALWRHEKKAEGGEAATVFLTGVIDLGIHGEIPIVVFKNDKKKDGSKQPDYRILLSRQAEKSGAAANAAASGGEDDLPF